MDGNRSNGLCYQKALTIQMEYIRSRLNTAYEEKALVQQQEDSITQHHLMLFCKVKGFGQMDALHYSVFHFNEKDI